MDFSWNTKIKKERKKERKRERNINTLCWLQLFLTIPTGSLWQIVLTGCSDIPVLLYLMTTQAECQQVPSSTTTSRKNTIMHPKDTSVTALVFLSNQAWNKTHHRIKFSEVEGCNKPKACTWRTKIKISNLLPWHY